MRHQVHQIRGTQPGFQVLREILAAPTDYHRKPGWFGGLFLYQQGFEPEQGALPRSHVVSGREGGGRKRSSNLQQGSYLSIRPQIQRHKTDNKSHG